MLRLSLLALALLTPPAALAQDVVELRCLEGELSLDLLGLIATGDLSSYELQVYGPGEEACSALLNEGLQRIASLRKLSLFDAAHITLSGFDALQLPDGLFISGDSSLGLSSFNLLDIGRIVRTPIESIIEGTLRISGVDAVLGAGVFNRVGSRLVFRRGGRFISEVEGSALLNDGELVFSVDAHREIGGIENRPSGRVEIHATDDPAGQESPRFSLSNIINHENGNLSFYGSALYERDFLISGSTLSGIVSLDEDASVVLDSGTSVVSGQLEFNGAGEVVFDGSLSFDDADGQVLALRNSKTHFQCADDPYCLIHAPFAGNKIEVFSEDVSFTCDACISNVEEDLRITKLYNVELEIENTESNVNFDSIFSVDSMSSIINYSRAFNIADDFAFIKTDGSIDSALINHGQINFNAISNDTDIYKWKIENAEGGKIYILSPSQIHFSNYSVYDSDHLVPWTGEFYIERASESQETSEIFFSGLKALNQFTVLDRSVINIVSDLLVFENVDLSGGIYQVLVDDVFIRGQVNVDELIFSDNLANAIQVHLAGQLQIHKNLEVNSRLTIRDALEVEGEQALVTFISSLNAQINNVVELDNVDIQSFADKTEENPNAGVFLYESGLITSPQHLEVGFDSISSGSYQSPDAFEGGHLINEGDVTIQVEPLNQVFLVENQGYLRVTLLENPSFERAIALLGHSGWAETGVYKIDARDATPGSDAIYFYDKNFAGTLELLGGHAIFERSQDTLSHLYVEGHGALTGELHLLGVQPFNIFGWLGALAHPTLTFNQRLEIDPEAALEIPVYSDEVHGEIRVLDGGAQLSGQLQLRLMEGYSPQPGLRLEIGRVEGDVTPAGPLDLEVNSEGLGARLHVEDLGGGVRYALIAELLDLLAPRFEAITPGAHSGAAPYGIGAEIPILLRMTEEVRSKAGQCQLSLSHADIGVLGRATISPEAAVAALEFTYVVAEGHRAPALYPLTLDVTACELEDLWGNALDPTLEPLRDAALGLDLARLDLAAQDVALQGIEIDGVPPEITDVWISTEAGEVARVGDRLTVHLSFSEPVDLTAPLTLSLSSGDAVTFEPAVGVEALEAAFTLQAYPPEARLEITSVAAATPPADQAGNPAALDLGGGLDLEITGEGGEDLFDAQIPQLIGAGFEADGPLLGLGDQATVELRFDRPVRVEELALRLNVEGALVPLALVDEGALALRGVYTVAEGDRAAALEVVGLEGRAFALNNANDVDLSSLEGRLWTGLDAQGAPEGIPPRVDAVAPTLEGLEITEIPPRTIIPNPERQGFSIDLRFSEPVGLEAGGSLVLQLDTTPGSDAVLVGGAHTRLGAEAREDPRVLSLYYAAEIPDVEAAHVGVAGLGEAGARVLDEAGNALALEAVDVAALHDALEAHAVTIDTRPPRLEAIIIEPLDGERAVYDEGARLQIGLIFSEPVYLLGTLTVRLNNEEVRARESDDALWPGAARIDLPYTVGPGQGIDGLRVVEITASAPERFTDKGRLNPVQIDLDAIEQREDIHVGGGDDWRHGGVVDPDAEVMAPDAARTRLDAALPETDMDPSDPRYARGNRDEEGAGYDGGDSGCAQHPAASPAPLGSLALLALLALGIRRRA